MKDFCPSSLVSILHAVVGNDWRGSASRPPISPSLDTARAPEALLKPELASYCQVMKQDWGVQSEGIGSCSYAWELELSV
jgi:hypothetical protein